MNCSISVGARKSPLSQKQVDEVLHEIRNFYPNLAFSCHWMQTSGDKNLHISLKEMENSDFFTKEITESQKQGSFRISIHSAKDLPRPLPEWICIAAITKGKDPADSLVLPEGKTLQTLGSLPKIGTSSKRREIEIQKIIPNAQFVDIRGTIEKRLELLHTGAVDALVVAEAALLRLDLGHLNRVRLSGAVAKYQGQLAVLAKNDDVAMHDLFSCIDTRPRVLYFGLEAPQNDDVRMIHYPLITTRPLPKEDSMIQKGLLFAKTCSHVIVTSKMAVRYLFELHPLFRDDVSFISVGKATTKELEKRGIRHIMTASEETQEGIISLLSENMPAASSFFWPRSLLARNTLLHFLEKSPHPFFSCVLYETHKMLPNNAISFDDVDELFFSSPSCVDAFFEFFKELPKGKKVRTQGPITEKQWSLYDPTV
jgi:hydroxymethylbilane synthase